MVAMSFRRFGLPQLLWVCICLLLLPSAGFGGETVSDGLAGKVITGYQGWFGCPNDYEGNDAWMHWFKGGVPDTEHLRVELLPDVSEYPKAALCQTGLRRADGTPIELFSSAKPGAVQLHFQWMKRYGIDGAAVQRFIGVTSKPASLHRWDHILGIERAAAEQNGRAFYVCYDISGGNPKTLIDDIKRDWQHLVNDLHITSSPSYLRDHGKPVLEIWGLGVADRAGTPEEIMELIGALKSGSLGVPVTVVGGVPAEWRTLDGSSKKDPEWESVFHKLDVISPWYTGRPKSVDAVNAYMESRVAGDAATTKELHIGFMPVVFPGFSWSNHMRVDKGKATPLNQVPRLCGEFYWSQIKGMLGLHAQSLYVAMFDEVDEGTAVLKAVEHPAGLPAGVPMVALDADGCNMSKDAYLRITGAVGRYLRSGTTPPAGVRGVLQ
jgi:hypothetical protein